MRRGKKRGKLYLFLLFLALLGGSGYYLYTSSLFERTPPVIEAKETIYWNLKEPIKIPIKDNIGLKSYKVVFDSSKEQKVIAKKEFSEPVQKSLITIDPPEDFEGKRALLIVTVTDTSRWNYFLGNQAKKEIKIIIDTKRPELFVVNNSYAITKGGSALVIFKCSDPHLKEFYIQTNFKKRFKAVPFYKDGYYIALLAWPLYYGRFRAYVVAYDKAGNRAKVYIPYFLRNKRYHTSKIRLTDRFLNGKVAQLAEDYPEAAKLPPLEKFKFVNEKLRAQNEKLIHTLTFIVDTKTRVDDFYIKPFKPLKNAAAVARFGDHRYYYYKGKLVSEAYHLGLDLASVKHAPIKASNAGEVKFANFNGIYGNMPLLAHGLGLYTLYGHCSTVLVQKGDHVRPHQTIAKTGTTGLALGDHLHFGVLVQGVEVRPSEWMDAHWIKVNISDVISDAKKVIESK